MKFSNFARILLDIGPLYHLIPNRFLYFKTGFFYSVFKCCLSALFILCSSGAPAVSYCATIEIFPVVWELGLRHQAENIRCCISHILSSNNHCSWYKTSPCGSFERTVWQDQLYYQHLINLRARLGREDIIFRRV